MDKPKKPGLVGPDLNADQYPGVAVGVPVPFVGDVKVGAYAGWGDYVSLEATVAGNRLQFYNSYTEPGVQTVRTDDHTYVMDSRSVHEFLTTDAHGESIGSVYQHQHTAVYTELATDTNIVIHNTSDASNGYSLNETGIPIANAQRFAGPGASVTAGGDDGIVALGRMLDDAVEAGTQGGVVHAEVMSVAEEGSPDAVFVRLSDQPQNPDAITGNLGDGSYREIVYRDDGIATFQDFLEGSSDRERCPCDR